MKLKWFLLGFLAITACSDDDDVVQFRGLVIDFKDSKPVADISIRFASYQLFFSDSITRPEYHTKSNAVGEFFFEFPRTALPSNGAFQYIVEDQNFYQLDRRTMTCDGSGTDALINYGGNNYITVYVDKRSWVTLEFDKVNHSSGDSIQFVFEGCAGFQTTRQIPDQMFTFATPVDYFMGAVDLEYFIRNISGAKTLLHLNDVVLVPGDTTNVRIEY